MSNYTSGVLAQFKIKDVFEDESSPHVNACFFMPCTDQGRKVALSVVAMFKSQGHGAEMTSAHSTRVDLGRYEVNACQVPHGLAREIDQLFQDQLESISREAKVPAEKLGYGSGIHEIQDRAPQMHRTHRGQRPSLMP